MPLRKRLALGYARLRVNGWEAWLGLLTTFTIAQFLSGQPDPVSQVAHAWSWLWLVSYGLSGLLLFVGIATAHDELEAFGLFLLGGGAVIQTIATLALSNQLARLPHHPPLPNPLFLGLTIASLVAQCANRIAQILHGQRPVVAETLAK